MIAIILKFLRGISNEHIYRSKKRLRDICCTVSKVAYPVHMCASFASQVATKALAIDFLITIPIRLHHTFYYRYPTIQDKLTLAFNIHYKINTYDKVATLLAAGSTIFTPQELKSTWNTALNDAKLSEKTTENTLCFGDILCNPGDQYGLLDWAYDNILP